MFRKVKRFILPNPFEQILKRAVRNKNNKFLIEWNRGLGDIPLGLYAMVYRIRQIIKDSEITFLVREDLKDGFCMFENSFSKKVHFICVPFWKRKEPYCCYLALKQVGVDPKSFDVIIEKPDPTHWTQWQLGRLTPKLNWKAEYDLLWKKFPIEKEKKYIAMQPQVETNYNLHRNWPIHRWKQLISLCEKKQMQTILVGTKPEPEFKEFDSLDLRGKTNLFEVLSILKNCCSYFITPDSGLLAFIYYLNETFPLSIISLWSDPGQGVLKQKVASPNPLLKHVPIQGTSRDLHCIETSQILEQLFLEEKSYERTRSI